LPSVKLSMVTSTLSCTFPGESIVTAKVSAPLLLLFGEHPAIDQAVVLFQFPDPSIQLITFEPLVGQAADAPRAPTDKRIPSIRTESKDLRTTFFSSPAQP